MLLDRQQVENIIPQKGPFVMVDSLVEAKETFIETNFKVRPENIFLQEEELREFAMIENIAQSCAVGIVYIKKNSNKGSREVDGFIGAISKLKKHYLPKVGQTLVTQIQILTELDGLFLLHGKIYVENKLLLEGDFKIATNKK